MIDPLDICVRIRLTHSTPVKGEVRGSHKLQGIPHLAQRRSQVLVTPSAQPVATRLLSYLSQSPESTSFPPCELSYRQVVRHTPRSNHVRPPQRETGGLGVHT